MLRSERDALCLQSWLRVIGRPRPFSMHGSLASKCTRQLWKPAKSLTLCILILPLCKSLVSIWMWKCWMEDCGKKERGRAKSRRAPPAPPGTALQAECPHWAFSIPCCCVCCGIKHSQAWWKPKIFSCPEESRHKPSSSLMYFTLSW